MIVTNEGNAVAMPQAIYMGHLTLSDTLGAEARVASAVMSVRSKFYNTSEMPVK